MYLIKHAGVMTVSADPRPAGLYASRRLRLQGDHELCNCPVLQPCKHCYTVFKQAVGYYLFPGDGDAAKDMLEA